MISRRGLLLGLAAAPRRRFQEGVFPLGIASGEPSPDGFVLWTRLMPASPAPVPVSWEIAEDEAMRRVVRRGEATAIEANAHAVHVELRGLRAARWYYYRFRALGAESAVGRTRTAPAPGDAARFRFAVAGCQKWQDGYYTAYARMAEDDLDAVLHTGDYIYETASKPGLERSHDLVEAVTLEQYRDRYALYKSDADLQLAHARFPFVVTWDDHEAADNYAGLISDRDFPVELFPERRRVAYQVYFEHMPLRAAARRSRQVIRRWRWGQTADIHVLDTRQFRADQACGDRAKPPCEEWRDPSRTMLGAAQEAWLREGMSRSRAAWNILQQQVIFAPFDIAPGEAELYSMDKWDGYPAARAKLLSDFSDLRRAKPSFSPVVLTGDNHNHWAFSLESPAGRRVGFEFAGTSITSGADGSDRNQEYGSVLEANDHVLFHSGRRGYLRCDVNLQAWTTEYVTLPYVSRRGAPAQVAARFRLEQGSLAVSKA
jgi:alkaline phosphatase D